MSSLRKLLKQKNYNYLRTYVQDLRFYSITIDQRLTNKTHVNNKCGGTGPDALSLMEGLWVKVLESMAAPPPQILGHLYGN